MSHIAGLVSTGQFGGVLNNGHCGGRVGTGHCGGSVIQCWTVGQFGGALSTGHPGGSVIQCWTVGQFAGALSTGHCGGIVRGHPRRVFGRHAPVTVGGGGASVDSAPGAFCTRQSNVGIGQLTPGIVAMQSTVGKTSSLPSGTGQFEPGTVSGNGQFTYGMVFGMHDRGGRVGNGPNGSALAASFAFGVDFAAVSLLEVDFFSATFFSSFRKFVCYVDGGSTRAAWESIGRRSFLGKIESGALASTLIFNGIRSLMAFTSREIFKKQKPVIYCDNQLDIEIFMARRQCKMPDTLIKAELWEKTNISYSRCAGSPYIGYNLVWI